MPDHDGSGAHGAEDPTWSDSLTKFLWQRAADIAESMGLSNAARHMRHYLGNSGNTLTVDVDDMLNDLPGLERQFQDEIEACKAAIARRLGDCENATDQTFELTGKKQVYYAHKSESRDWFFALGGFTYWYTADVTVERGDSGVQITVEIRLHVFDRYNWDKGKSVDIGPIHVKDRSLGRLHRVGYAHEFDVEGKSSDRTFRWSCADVESAGDDSGDGSGDGSGGSDDPGEDSDRREERDDPGRDRRTERESSREDERNRTERSDE